MSKSVLLPLMVCVASLSFSFAVATQDLPSACRPLAPPSDAAVILFRVTETNTYAWVILADGVRASYHVAISQSELRDLVTAFLDLVAGTPRRGEEMVQYLQLLQQSKELYDLLIAPAEGHLRGLKYLVVVPSDALWYLPFPALYRCPGCGGRELFTGRFLIEDLALVLASSLGSALAGLSPGAEPGLQSALVVAPDPYGMMPDARYEAQRVAALFPEATVLLGAEATESRVKDLLGTQGYNVLHITGGLELHHGDPLRSGITLVSSGTDDGSLQVWEMLNLRVRTKLLVLSGGLSGESDKAEDALPMVLDALGASGVASVLFTLECVPAHTAATVMSTVYEGLQEGLSRAEALRQAQLKLRGVFNNPRDWALFALYGDWRGISVLQLPGMEKLDYSLARLLAEWKRRAHPPDEAVPVVSVLVALHRSATSDDLEAFGDLSSEVELVGSFGAFVQVRIPLPLLEALAQLPQVRSISVPPETIHN